MRTEVFYKCVAINDDGSRVSFAVPRPFKYTYQPHVWTPRRKYGPFVFSSLDDVRGFLADNKPGTGNYLWEVWACETRDARPVSNVVPVSFLSLWTKEEVLAAMKNPTSKQTISAPQGSYIAAQIKLLNQVDPYGWGILNRS